MGCSPYSCEARIFILVILPPESAPLLETQAHYLNSGKAAVTQLARRWNLFPEQELLNGSFYLLGHFKAISVLNNWISE